MYLIYVLRIIMLIPTYHISAICCVELIGYVGIGLVPKIEIMQVQRMK